MALLYPGTRGLSEAMRHALYDGPTESSADMRGLVVFDRNHRKIGIVSEVYCSEEDLKARYIEITSFKGSSDATYMYPFDYVRWTKSGVFIDSTQKTLRAYEEYNARHVMQHERKSLVSYGEALEIGYDFDLQQCA